MLVVARRVPIRSGLRYGDPIRSFRPPGKVVAAFLTALVAAGCSGGSTPAGSGGAGTTAVTTAPAAGSSRSTVWL
ncbi:MAG TPA: hypothetical protein VFH45_10030, partial [Acidimicrobiales bacterium]|nr:hypothetical protein [Acidimicrobiales bacterium]